jgi:TonB family protein
MILAILAAVAGGATQAQTPPAPTPVVTVLGRPPVAAKVNVDSSDENSIDLVSVWPMGAYQARINGKVVLSCWVDAYGLAESCRVESETPEHMGFGAAALQLRTTFKLKPAVGPNGPIASQMSIAVNFKAPDPQFGIGASSSAAIPNGEGSADNVASGIQVQNPLTMRPVTMLDRPVWVRAASFEDLARAYPADAANVEGYAVAHCKVEPSGDLTNCQIIKETPDKLGFGAAALSLAGQFQVAPAWTRAPDRGELWVDLPIRFPPSGAVERTVATPTWLVGVDPDSMPEVFPPEAAAEGVTTGTGVARCFVKVDGSLTGCSPEAGDPDGLGFSEAAVRLASVMKMNPWTADAAPVNGATVEVRIQLNLKAGS